MTGLDRPREGGVAAAPQRAARRMLALYDGPQRWTKGAFARDATGARVDVRSPRVACFCLHTCMVRACEAEGLSFGDLDRTWKAFDRLTGGVMAFNDAPATTYGDVIALIERIARDPDP